MASKLRRRRYQFIDDDLRQKPGKANSANHFLLNEPRGGFLTPAPGIDRGRIYQK
jgi:hypothetical protein